MRYGMRRRWRRFVLVFLFYAALAVLLTMPLALHLTTHVTGDGIDDPSLAWNLWWVKFALVDRHLSDIFRCNWMFYPLGINLAFYTLTPLNGLEAIPLWVSLGHVVAVNILLWFSFTMAGFGTYLLTLELLPRRMEFRLKNAAAILAGIFYAFASPKLFYAALGQFNISSSLWIPFVVLYLERARRSMRWRDAFLASMFLLFEAWSELSFASFLILWVALWAVWELVASVGDRKRAFKIAAMSAVMGAIFLVGVSPFLAHMLPDMKRYGDFWAPGGGFADVFSADLLGFLIPTMHNPIFGKIVGGFKFPHDKGQQLYLGYTLISLSAFGIWKWRRNSRVRFMAVAAAVFFLLSLGPQVRFDGRNTGIPGPFELLAHVPLLKGNRYPSRYSVLLYLALAELAAFGFVSLAGALGRARRGGESKSTRSMLPGSGVLGIVVAALFLLEHLSVPMPLSNLKVPAPYSTIARDGSRGAVLDLPLGWRNGFDVFGKSDVAIMYAQWYQSAHHHPIFGGNTSRNPEIKFRYFLETPLLGDLAVLQRGKKLPPPGKKVALIRQLACDLNLEYVVLHPAKLRRDTIAYVRQALPLKLVDEGDGVQVYAVENACARRSGMHQLPAYMFAEGWHDGVFRLDGIEGTAWAWSKDAVFFYLMAGDEKSITLEIRSPGEQRISLAMNGHDLGEKDVTSGVGRYTWSIPGSARSAGLARFVVSASGKWPLSAATRGPWSWRGVEVSIPVLARSAGKDFGDFAHVYVGGIDHSPNRRGYNLVAVDPASGRVMAAASFDTFRSASESRRMAEWIAGWPAGTLIAGAVRDEASMHLGRDAVDALKKLGVSGAVKGHFRRAQAFVAVAGGGKSLEKWSDVSPVAVEVGGGWVRPWVRFGLEGVQVR